MIGAYLDRMMRRLRRPQPLASIKPAGVRPLTEGYTIKGGQNAFPSQIKERPAAPAPMNKTER